MLILNKNKKMFIPINNFAGNGYCRSLLFIYSNLLRLSIAIFFCCSFLNLGCGKNPEQGYLHYDGDNVPVYGDKFVTASIGDARTLVPILASDGASAGICGLIFNGLVKYNKDLLLVGDLALRWEIKNNGLVIIFYLRKDVKWHDGEKFTAKDVEFTYKKLIDPDVMTPYSGDFEKVEKFEIIDDYTIKIIYKEPFSPGLCSWSMNIMPEHILSKEDLNKTSFSRNPVGTGPYKFKEWKIQELITLSANPDYFEGRPYIDQYIFRIIPDSATMFLELQNRGIDQMGLTSLQFIRQTNTSFFQRYYQKFQYQGFSFTYLGYNLNSAKFQDVRIRQAINYAVNREEIIQGVLLGMGTECTGPFAPRSWAYNSKVEPVAYSREKALQLLAEAGWRLNEHGWLQKDGDIFEFTIITNQGNEERKRCAEIIQKCLRNIGMKVKIKIIEWSVFINEFINKRKFEAILLGWSLSLDPDIYDIWHSSKTKQGDFNFVNYQNSEVDRLLEQGRREFAQEKRKEIYHKIHQIIYQEQPYLFLYNPDSLPIVSSRFKGIKVEALGIDYNFIKWYVPKKNQIYLQQ
ncbi:MAG: peptide-binding protein [Candidatus Omnitrophota bacterium]|nr:MAG: peptide-binding protein [Candidatus Omnitrophota bacterium]